MYCPKCGGQNSDDLAFCRHCGEDLKIISQAMSGHAPLEIASKIDAVIGTGYERFRRDAILWLFWAIVLTATYLGRIIWIGSNFDWRLFVQNASVFLIAFAIISIPSILMFTAALWNFLLFRRARYLARNHARGIEPRADAENVFCSNCGTPNPVNANACISCAFDVQLLTGDPQDNPVITRWLDRSLKRRSFRRPRTKTLSNIAVGAVFWLSFAILQFNFGNWGDTIIYSILAVTRTCVKLWDLIYFERQQKLTEQEPLDETLVVPRRIQPATPWEFLEQLKKMPLVEDEVMTSNGPVTEFETQPLVQRSQVERLVLDEATDGGATTRKLGRETGE